MIHYVVRPETRTVIGVMKGTKYDAILKIYKMLDSSELCLLEPEKYYMPNCYRAEVVCDPRDEFNVEEGKRIVKERIMRRYYDSVDKRVDRFKRNFKMLCEKISKTSTKPIDKK